MVSRSSFSMGLPFLLPLLEPPPSECIWSSAPEILRFDPPCLCFFSFLSFFFFFFLSIEDLLSTEDSKRDDCLDFLCFLCLLSSEFSRETAYSTISSTVPGLLGRRLRSLPLTLYKLSSGVTLDSCLSCSKDWFLEFWPVYWLASRNGLSLYSSFTDESVPGSDFWLADYDLKLPFDIWWLYLIESCDGNVLSIWSDCILLAVAVEPYFIDWLVFSLTSFSISSEPDSSLAEDDLELAPDSEP